MSLALLFLAPLLQDEGEDLRALAAEAASLAARGEYRKAEKTLEELLRDFPGDPRLLTERGRIRLALGRYDEANADLEKALSGRESDPQWRYWLGEGLRLRGRYREAEAQYDAVPEGRLRLPALERRAYLLWEEGRRDEAQTLWKEIAAVASRRLVEMPPELVALGRAYVRLRQFAAASEVFLEAEEKDPGNAEACQELGDLYLRVYGDAAGIGPSPKETYDLALRRNPNAVDVLCSVYELYRANFFRDQSQSDEILARALATNPSSGRALLLQAGTLVWDRRFDDAEAPVRKALELNPKDRRARALRAVLAFLRQDQGTFQEEEKSLLAADPRYGELYALLGRSLRELYRFADAVPWLRKALELDPELNDARTDLGLALIHSGAEKEGLAALEAAEKAEPGFVHPWRRNMLTVLRKLREKYVLVRDPPFEHFLHPEGADALKLYLLPQYQEAWKTLAAKYGYTPSAPVLVETFHEAGDFSTRTIGYTGFGALGACFGPVVTAVSPAEAQLRGRFNYLATAWHEFAHVITLGLSKSRIPRWLTEGLSTYEEKQRHPAYDRGMELELLDAYANDEIYPVMELNSAFRGPRILFGYYQGGLICEYLAREYSFARLVQMVQLYGEDRSTESIFEECFGLNPREFDSRFLRFVEERLRNVRVEPRLGPKKLAAFRDRVRRDDKDLEALRCLGWNALRSGNLVDADLRLRRILEVDPENGPGLLLAGELALARGRKDLALRHFERGFARGAEEFFARLHYASLVEGNGEYEKALEQFRLAKRAFPRMRDPRHSPHLEIRRLLEGAGRLEEAMQELEEFVALDGSNGGGRMELAEWHAERKDFEAACRYLEEANAVDPLRRTLHERWARALRELRRLDESVREWRAARAVRPEWEDPKASPVPRADEERAQASLLVEEAETERLAGRPTESKAALLEALRLDPSNGKARSVLEEIEKSPR